MTTGQLKPTAKLWRGITIDIDDKISNDILGRSLSEAERTHLYMRFGLTGKAPTTLDETDELLEASADDVRKAEAGALRKLRTALVG